MHKITSFFLSNEGDILLQTVDQKFLMAPVDGAIYAEIDSEYGHDGFLLEFDKLTEVITAFYSNTLTQKKSA